MVAGVSISFSQAWQEALAGCVVGRAPSQLDALARTLQQLEALGALREPHIEEFEGEIRFTWNRDGHCIDVSVCADGAVEWFYGRPDRTYEGGESLDDRFRVVMAEQATPR